MELNTSASRRIFREKSKWLATTFKELKAEEFYLDLFGNCMELKGDKGSRSSNPIFAYKVKEAYQKTPEQIAKERDEKPDAKISEIGERTYFRNEIAFKDTFRNSIKLTQGNPMALCSGCTYSGRTRTAKNAYKCHAFIIDLDGVGMRELDSLFAHIEFGDIPRPTYTVNSGHGLHLYYKFQNPVPLYPAVRKHLQKLKHGLTETCWQRETSTYKPVERQYQGIYQCFRMVGSCTKLKTDKTPLLVRAFKTGREWSIWELNKYVEEKYRIPDTPDYASWEWADENHHTLEECKTLYPEWYQKRIIEGLPANQWRCNKGLYNWWLKKIQEWGNARDGNRYNCIAVLYVFGVKCMIPKEMVDADAYALVEPFNELTQRPDNDFTEEDVYAASKFYNTDYVKMSRTGIERKTGIRIEPTKRNGRKREEHLKIARFIRDELGKGNNGGRQDKSELVREWRKTHPDGKKADCIRETGLSKPTVIKWWNGKEN